MNETLFGDFSAVDSKLWKNKIQYDLKGQDYNQLIWESLEGISVKPFYNSEDTKSEQFPIPDVERNWNIGDVVYSINPPDLYEELKEKARQGVTAPYVKIEGAIPDFEAIQNIDFQQMILHLDKPNRERIMALNNAIEKMDLPVFLDHDPLADFLKSGQWTTNQKEDLELLSDCSQTTNNVTVDSTVYQEAGANAIQQLAFSINQLLEYTRLAKPEKLNVFFKVSCAGNYFFEIAKIKALRWLFDSVCAHLKIEGHCHIMAQPALRNKSVYDYNVNMLRTTSECMAGILGGADVVVNRPYDDLFHHPNEFGDRIARNQLLILKEEAYFNTPNKAVRGNYYLNSLVIQMADKATQLFQKIEKDGGWLHQVFKGDIQKRIQKSGEKEQQLFDDGKLPLLGVNLQANPQDKMKEQMEKNPFPEPNVRKTLITPLTPKRLAEKLEFHRFNNE